MQNLAIAIGTMQVFLWPVSCSYIHAIRMLHIIITMYIYIYIYLLHGYQDQHMHAQAPIKGAFINILTMMITISAKITIIIRKRITIVS